MPPVKPRPRFSAGRSRVGARAARSPRRRGRPLTKRQQEILRTIYDFTQEHGYPPTLADLAELLDCTTSTAQGHVDRLIRKGSLSRDGEGRRTLKIVDAAFLREYGSGLPFAGRVNAGEPMEAIEEAELLEVSDLVNPPAGCFALQVSGDSMVEAGIHDGDYVLIDPKRPATNGSIVVALTDEGEATLKEFYRERNRIRLQPRNKRFKPIYIKDVNIRGVLIGVIRRLS